MKRAPDAAPVRLRHERRIGVDREGSAGDAGVEEALEDRGRVAAPAAARIVGDVGKEQGRLCRIGARVEHAPRRLLDREQARGEAVALVPQVLGELARECVRRGLVAAGRDDRRSCRSSASRRS